MSRKVPKSVPHVMRKRELELNESLETTIHDETGKRILIPCMIVYVNTSSRQTIREWEFIAFGNGVTFNVELVQERDLIYTATYVRRAIPREVGETWNDKGKQCKLVARVPYNGNCVKETIEYTVTDGISVFLVWSDCDIEQWEKLLESPSVIEYELPTSAHVFHTGTGSGERKKYVRYAELLRELDKAGRGNEKLSIASYKAKKEQSERDRTAEKAGYREDD